MRGGVGSKADRRIGGEKEIRKLHFRGDGKVFECGEARGFGSEIENSYLIGEGEKKRLKRAEIFATFLASVREDLNE